MTVEGTKQPQRIRMEKTKSAASSTENPSSSSSLAPESPQRSLTSLHSADSRSNHAGVASSPNLQLGGDGTRNLSKSKSARTAPENNRNNTFAKIKDAPNQTRSIQEKLFPGANNPLEAETKGSGSNSVAHDVKLDGTLVPVGGNQAAALREVGENGTDEEGLDPPCCGATLDTALVAVMSDPIDPRGDETNVDEVEEDVVPIAVQKAHDLYAQWSTTLDSAAPVASNAAIESENHEQEDTDGRDENLFTTEHSTVSAVVVNRSEEEHTKNEKDAESDDNDEENVGSTVQKAHELYYEWSNTLGSVAVPVVTSEAIAEAKTSQGGANETRKGVLKTDGDAAIFNSLNANSTVDVSAQEKMEDAQLPEGNVEMDEVIVQKANNEYLQWTTTLTDGDPTVPVDNKQNKAGTRLRAENDASDIAEGYFRSISEINSEEDYPGEIERMDEGFELPQADSNTQLGEEDAISSDSFATFDSAGGMLNMQDAHDIYQQLNATPVAQEVSVAIATHDVKSSGKEESQTPIYTDETSAFGHLRGGDEDGEQDQGVRLTHEEARVRCAQWSVTLGSQDPSVAGINATAKESGILTTEQSRIVHDQDVAAFGSNRDDCQDIDKPDDETCAEEWHTMLPPIREEGDIQETDMSNYEPCGDSVVPTVQDVRKIYDEWKAVLSDGTPYEMVANYSSEENELVAEGRDMNVASKFDDLPRRELQRLGLEDYRRKSTGSILDRPTKKDSHSTLKPTVSSVLELTIDVNEEAMGWRNSMLKELKENKDIVEAMLVLKSTSEFLHPLHEGEDPKEQRLRLLADDDDVSVMSTDSTWSNWSSASVYQSWFGASPQRRAAPPRISSNPTPRNDSIPMKRNQHQGRRFIDLTVFSGLDGAEEDWDDDILSDHSDGSSGDATSYSIPVQATKKRDPRRSIARQFLDFTDPNDDPPDPGPKGFRFSWRGVNRSSSMGHMSSSSISNASVADLGELHQEEEEEDPTMDEDCDYDDVALYSTAAWEAADTAFIENVKDIATNLERALNEQSLESPFWAAEEIIPTFKALHSKVKESMDRLKKESETTPAPATPVATTDSKVGSSSGGKRVRLSQRKSTDFGEIRGRTLMPPDDLGGYDDLGMRTLHRDDRAYLKQFLYDYRRDGTCSLPLVLASGLEKHLCDTTIGAALDILSNLTSPLRRRRPEMATVQEEGEDGSLRDDSDRSQRSGRSNSVFENLEQSMGQLVDDASERQQEELELSISITD